MKIHSWLVSNIKWNFISFFYIKLQIRNTLDINDIIQKIQGIEFNIAPIEEDRQIGFTQGYKAMLAHHRTDSSGQRDVEDSDALVDQWVNRPNEW